MGPGLRQLLARPDLQGPWVGAHHLVRISARLLALDPSRPGPEREAQRVHGPGLRQLLARRGLQRHFGRRSRPGPESRRAFCSLGPSRLGPERDSHQRCRADSLQGSFGKATKGKFASVNLHVG